jgi:hypothetical protein
MTVTGQPKWDHVSALKACGRLFFYEKTKVMSDGFTANRNTGGLYSPAYDTT